MSRRRGEPTWPPGAWDPIHKGEVYCAPACGAKCTYAAFERATAAADKLCRRLKRTTGNDWAPHVWENMGWHYSARCNGWKVHPRSGCLDGIRGYVAFLGTSEFAGGIWAEHGKTPHEAIENTRAVALEELTEKAALLDMQLVPVNHKGE